MKNVVYVYTRLKAACFYLRWTQSHYMGGWITERDTHNYLNRCNICNIVQV